MTATTASAIAAATTAALAIKAAKEAGAEATEIAFRASAEATAAALEVKGVSAAALAAANKAAGAGYGSDAAVGFHAVTGLFLRLPVEEWDGKASSLQSRVKKIGQAKAKAILKKVVSKGGTIDEAVEAIDEAVAALGLDIDKALAALLTAAQKVADARANGQEFVDDQTDTLAEIDLALNTIRTGIAPVEVTVEDLRLSLVS